MRKHLQNLERFCQKLQFRYGDNDELVIELKNELESLKAKKSTYLAGALQNWGHQGPLETTSLH